MPTLIRPWHIEVQLNGRGPADAVARLPSRRPRENHQNAAGRLADGRRGRRAPSPVSRALNRCARLAHRPSAHPPPGRVGLPEGQPVARSRPVDRARCRRSPATAPSKSIDSIRTWSWNHSRWRRLGVAAATARCWCGAQCPDTSQAVRRRPRPRRGGTRVIPPQRVTSICRQSTYGRHPVEVDQVVAVLPGRHVGRDRGRGPGRGRRRSSELTGSSNQRTSRSAAARITRIACLRLVARRWRRRTARRRRRWSRRAAAIRARSRSTLGAPRLADLDLHPGDALLVHPAGELRVLPLGVVGGEAAAAVDRAPRARAVPSSRASGRSSRRALRSHSAQSAADSASPATPGRPALRSRRCIAVQAAGTSSGSRSATRRREQVRSPPRRRPPVRRSSRCR